MERIKRHSRKVWHFLWKEDSAWSWIANIIVAFLVIRYIVYPLLGIILGTPFPIVAVVSESMEHGLHNQIICGQRLEDFQHSFDNYWTVCGSWYEEKGITKEEFQTFPFKNGFDKGDVIILWRANENNLDVGDILIFQGNRVQPIIHRIIDINNNIYHTKGDHNSESITTGFDETHITEEEIYGKGLIRIPYLGWVKILFVDLVRPLGISIVR